MASKQMNAHAKGLIGGSPSNSIATKHGGKMMHKMGKKASKGSKAGNVHSPHGRAKL